MFKCISCKTGPSSLSIYESPPGEGAMPSFIFLYDARLSIDCSSATEAGIVGFTSISFQVSVIKVGNLHLDKETVFVSSPNAKLHGKHTFLISFLSPFLLHPRE